MVTTASFAIWFFESHAFKAHQRCLLVSGTDTRLARYVIERTLSDVSNEIRTFE